MTKNRAQPTRYRPGKAETQDAETSSEDEESASDNERQNAAPPVPSTRPAATSFPAKQQERKKIAIDARKVGAQTTIPVSQLRQSGKGDDEDLEGFVTASESSASGDERSNDEAEAKSASSDSEQEEDDDDDEDSSSLEEEQTKKPLLRPTFLSKAQRLAQTSSTTTTPATQTTIKPLEADTLRKQKADDLLRIQLERDAAAKAAGKKSWDDEDFAPEEEVDDTDNLDPETEYAAWKLRELKRVRRERLLIEEREKEREEVERRRGLTAEEREAEDRAYVAAQQAAAQEEGDGRGKMGYMQKYFHSGAFFNSEAGQGEGEPDAEVQAALNRSFAGAKFEDETGDKSALPQYMRIRDMTRLGRKGRTKYQDLKSEDTGRWGAETGRRREDGGGGDARGLDERFRPDDSGWERERTGANATAVGERRRFDGENGGRDEKRARYG